MSTVSIQVRFTPEAAAIAKQLTENAVLRALDRSVQRIKLEAASVTPIRTGDLLKSLVVGTGLKTLYMTYTAPHAKIADEGARPHVITPKSKKVLHFFKGTGEEVFTKFVKHPGYPGWEFSKDMRELAKKILLEELTSELQAVSVP